MKQSEVLQLLAEGDMEPLGTMPWGSNYTFLVQVTSPKGVTPEQSTLAVYKPRRGEAHAVGLSPGHTVLA